MKRIEKLKREHQDQAYVCMALWEAGFAGTASAERGPIMMAAKRKVDEAYEAGFRACREIAVQLFNEAGWGHSPMCSEHQIYEARTCDSVCGERRELAVLGDDEVPDGA